MRSNLLFMVLILAAVALMVRDQRSPLRSQETQPPITLGPEANMSGIKLGMSKEQLLAGHGHPATWRMEGPYRHVNFADDLGLEAYLDKSDKVVYVWGTLRQGGKPVSFPETPREARLRFRGATVLAEDKEKCLLYWPTARLRVFYYFAVDGYFVDACLTDTPLARPPR